MNRTFRLPRQHGAWAFLLVPTFITAFLGAGNWRGILFAVTWVCAYPLSYFLTSGFSARVKRKKWTDRGRRELNNAAPWALLTFFGSVLILQNSPWIFLEALVLLPLWCGSLYLSSNERERGITNDFILVGIASFAPLFMYQIAQNQKSISLIPFKIWVTCILSFLFFFGSVLHVKALIRGAQNQKWHLVSIFFHAAVTLVLLIQKPELAITFSIATMRTLWMRPGIQPSNIGAIEGVVASIFIVTTIIAEN